MKTNKMLRNIILIFFFLILAGKSYAEEVHFPGETVTIFFEVIDNPENAAISVFHLEYDHEALELISSPIIRNDHGSDLDILGIPVGRQIPVSFIIKMHAASGSYPVNIVIEASFNYDEVPVASIKYSSAVIDVVAQGTCIQPINEVVSGKVGIYSSLPPFVIDMMDEAIKAEFPNLEPAFDGSFFLYYGANLLINELYSEMKYGILNCDMILAADPIFSLSLKTAGFLESIKIEGAQELFRFPYDKEGYCYPVLVHNMVLAYNPEKVEEWAIKGVHIPKTFKEFAHDFTLKGLISMGNPLTNGITYAAVASLIQEDHYGLEYLDSLAANSVMVDSGSTALSKLQTGECAAIMIPEESILKMQRESAEIGTPMTNIACIYPEDGVIMIPSNVMTIAKEHSANKNIKACEALEKWFLGKNAQKLLLQGYLHSVLTNMDEIPYNSIDTNWLIERNLDIDWENAVNNQEWINQAWIEKLTKK